MKYLKKYNELKSYTYRRTADKLKSLGHNRRAGVMIDWSTEIENRERESARLSEFKKNEPFGVFDLDIVKQRYNPTDKSYYDETVLSGKFLIGASFQSDWTYDMFSDNLSDDNGFKYGFSLVFEFSVMPADEETKVEFDKIYKWNDDFMSNGSYWCGRLYFNIIKPNGVLSIDPDGKYTFDVMENEGIVFKDRANALKFKKLFIDAISGKNNWGSHSWSPRGLSDEVKKFFTEKHTTRLTQEEFDKMMEGGYDKLVEATKKMSLNQLYRN